MRVLLHYSVSIAAAAATATYIPLSVAAAAVYTHMSAAARRIPLGQRLLGYLVEIPQW